jgi:ribosome-binding factor A
MVRATHSVRKEQICRLLQKELGTLFLTETAMLFSNAFISVTSVYLGNDFGVARVHLSFALNESKETLLQKVNYQKNTIRRLLGKRLASKMRKVPDLKFYIDDTVIQGARVTALIDQLGE